MRRVFRITSLLYLLVIGVLVAVITTGCTQEGGEGGNQGAQDQTGTTGKGGTIRVETTAVEENPTTRLTREETAREEQSRTQRRSTREDNFPGQPRNEQQTVTVRITGTEGLSFAGRVGSARDLPHVQGSVPEEYEIPSADAAVTVEIHKREPGGGTLGIEVVSNGQIIARQTVSTTVGEINITWTSQQRSNGG